MALVREAIKEIRTDWDSYSTFMEELRELMQAGVEADPDEVLETRAAALFTSIKKWADPEVVKQSDDYSAVKLYTSAAGYEQMFKTINIAFRTDRLIEQPSVLRSAVFMVELLNIDLYNYCVRYGSASDYTGRVYRGMVLSENELAQLAAVTSGPVDERYVAIPLGMASTTTDQTTALTFVEEETRRTSGGHPLLWDIEVARLPPDRVGIYRAAFPSSVVSTICAVPIERISDFAGEHEVLLRGPFFQILRLRRAGPSIGGKPLHVVEALMITANRDHPSTMQLRADEGTIARELFRTLVSAERTMRCAERAEQNGEFQDAAAFRRISSEQERSLENLVHLRTRRTE